MSLFKYENDILFLVEPFFHGIQYIDVAKKIQCEFVVLRRRNGPPVDNSLKAETIIVNIFDIAETAKVIKKRLLKKSYKNIGILPGNDFCVPVASELNEIFNLRSNSKESSIGARDKIVMRELLYKGQVNCPKSNSLTSVEQIIANRDNFTFPAVIKPPDMSSSLFVKRVDNFSQLLDAAEAIFKINSNVFEYPFHQAVLIEEYISGPEFSVELFLEDGMALFSSVTEKHKGPLPYFVETAHVVPSSSTSEAENKSLIAAGLRAAKAIGLQYGPIHAEMVLTENGPSIMEIAARIGGDNIMKLVKYATGIYIPELVIEQSLNYEINEILKKKTAGSVIKYLTPKPGKVVAIKGIQEAKANESLIDMHIEVSIGDYVKPLVSSEERIGYIIAKGKDGKAAYKAACEIENGIKIITE